MSMDTMKTKAIRKLNDDNTHKNINISKALHHKCMNLLFLPERHHISIFDRGANTCVLGKR
jgi:hypothetical protein